MDYASMTIRELKKLCAGKGLTKAVFGKSWSRMTKAELVEALTQWEQATQPVPKGVWNRRLLTTRISVSECNGQPWTVRIGFASEQKANLFYEWVLPYCRWAVACKPKQTACPVEIKVWGLSEEVLNKLVAKERTMLQKHVIQSIDGHKVECLWNQEWEMFDVDIDQKWYCGKHATVEEGLAAARQRIADEQLIKRQNQAWAERTIHGTTPVVPRPEPTRVRVGSTMVSID